MINVYVIEPPNIKYRQHLFPLLKPFFKKESLEDEKRQLIYGISKKEVSFVTDPSEANVAILPMSWNYYVAKGQVMKMQQLIQEVAKKGLQTWSYMAGDFGVKIPYMKNLMVFRNSGERNKLPNNHIGIPAFIKDPVKKHFPHEKWEARAFSEDPVVGFCGQSEVTLASWAHEIGKTGLRNCKSLLGLWSGPIQPLKSHVRTREKLLETLERDDRVISNFIKRRKYRAGVKDEKHLHTTTMEFYQNIQQTQYTLCVRGAGNFSIRFYETLAMGRIPLFINTNCLMPLQNGIDWKKQVVWVEYNERHTLVDQLMSFHHAHGQEGLEKIQQQNRELWRDFLTLGGFFKTFMKQTLVC